MPPTSTADEHRAVGVVDQVGERRAVDGRDERDATADDGARRLALLLVGDLVDDHDLGRLVLDGLDHHLVLQLGPLDGEHACVADGLMRHDARAADLHRLVDDDDDAFAAAREQARKLAEKRRLTHVRLADDQQAFAALLREALDGIGHSGVHQHRQHRPLDRAADARRHTSRPPRDGVHHP